MGKTLQNDKEVVEKGRKNTFKTVEEIEASLRDQISTKLLTSLNEKEIGQKIRKIWYGANAQRRNWLERQKEFLSDIDRFPESDAEGVFEMTSNLHIPMPFIVVKTFHARMMQALLAFDPILKPRRSDSVQAAMMLSELLRYTKEDWANEYEGLLEVLDEWIWTWCSTGVGILKTRWLRQFSRFEDVEDDIEMSVETKTDNQGFRHLVPSKTTKQVIKEKTVKTYEGPQVDFIQAEDLVMVGGKGNPQKADVCIHRQYLTSSEMFLLADQGIFLEEVVKKLVGGGGDNISAGDANDIKQDRAMNAGKSNIDDDTQLDRYEILEAYLQADVDGSGINSDIVAWVSTRTGDILRATYLYRLNRTGRRPFVKIDFHKRPGEDYGIGLLELLHPISVELDAMHNMRIDFGLLSTMPFGFYRPASNIEPETLRLQPGTLIPVDNPQTDVFFPNLGNRTSFGFQEEASLQTLVERLTGVSDLSLGVLSGNQGATRTARGVSALQGEQNTNLNIHLHRLNRGWKQLIELMIHLFQQRLPPGFEFRITGEDGNQYFRRIEPKDIVGDFDVEVVSDSAQSNPILQQQQADSILQLVLNPFLFQTGTATSGNLFEALKNWMQSRGIKDWSRFITKPADYSVQLTPEEEANRVLRKIPVPVTPEMDHEGFIAFWENMKDDDFLLGQFDETATVAMEQQSRKHQGMLQAMQAQEAQQANIQQQMINAAQAATPSPTAVPVNPTEP